MAIFEKTIRNKNFDKLLRKLEQEIPDSSWSDVYKRQILPSAPTVAKSCLPFCRQVQDILQW